REGLDLPEVMLVAILDADKEGFLRRETSLTQTIGRAARNKDSKVLMYADKMTNSMQRAINETNRRRKLQFEYNTINKKTPISIKKDIIDTLKISVAAEQKFKTKSDVIDNIEKLKAMMNVAVGQLDFEKAIELREEITNLKISLKKMK
ncbi:MAG: UvrB/UvrC motif-containing protein, partial [Clostridia bacterium]|nr:UvrB/UvrC motif-containing protein [Clostridia bacterium]